MRDAPMRYGDLLDRMVRRVDWDPEHGLPEALIRREWIVTNGLGGYASGTVSGLNTRRYHGWLVAALPNPLGRTVMLNRVEERVVSGGTAFRLDSDERSSGLYADNVRHIAEFRLEAGLPVWRFRVPGAEIEKRLLMVQGQNTVHVRYALLSGDTVRLQLRPIVHFRSYEAPVSTGLHERHRLTDEDDHIAIDVDASIPPLRMGVHGHESSFELHRERVENVLFRVERARGYDFHGALWSPGHYRVVLTSEQPVVLVASSETWDTARVVDYGQAPELERERRRRLVALASITTKVPQAAELVLAADQFLITPVGRHAEATRARAVGDEVRTLIAGYHWFTDWGRDTMISLEGLTLVTGREREAGFILRTFARYVRDGLIPNMFPDGSNEGLYHTADATMWFFHAIDRYLERTGDRDTLALIMPVLRSIVHAHVDGTRFGIGVDAGDGLLREGAEGYQLTWMDAKVGDWVVTPRRGKPVEINALWYNALCLYATWLESFGQIDEARNMTHRAEDVRRSFNARFWYEQGGYLYDVIDGPHGDSTEFRPNQLLAFSLRHPVLDEARWKRVLEQARERLVTPVGLRSLAPGSAGYCPRYDGDLRARDAAYHQGTVWGWLVGPWVDAWLRVYPNDRDGARAFVGGLLDAMSEFGVGTLAEIFDAEEPYTPRGCISQAWSVAETLRCIAKLEAIAPQPHA